MCTLMKALAQAICPGSVFKEKIANEISIPVSQQRLIIRGRKWKMGIHCTWFCKAAYPTHNLQTGTSSGITMGNNINDASAGGPRNRIGQVSHSVVLETLNDGEPRGKHLFQILLVLFLNLFGASGQTATQQHREVKLVDCGAMLVVRALAEISNTVWPAISITNLKFVQVNQPNTSTISMEDPTKGRITVQCTGLSDA
ncbi:hypothetical protein NC652_005170 [Populus alba x Populus x berolinensis]|nr:hypothetical protein NC652_005170 [Populus alba x Populus x berolinensis]